MISGLTEEQAYLTLQRQSRQKRRSMKEVAEAIVLSEEVKNSSKAAPPHARAKLTWADRLIQH